MKVEVRSAAAKGRGVFATSAINKGELICLNHVVEIPLDQQFAVRDMILGSYVFDWPGPRQTEKSKKWTSCCVVLGEGSIINHSGNPNSAWCAGKKESAIIFFALRRIEAGEEITHDYCWSKKDLEGFFD